jgi:hypothetical protein
VVVTVSSRLRQIALGGIVGGRDTLCFQKGPQAIGHREYRVEVQTAFSIAVVCRQAVLL